MEQEQQEAKVATSRTEEQRKTLGKHAHRLQHLQTRLKVLAAQRAAQFVSLREEQRLVIELADYQQLLDAVADDEMQLQVTFSYY